MVEYSAFNRLVPGSNPGQPNKKQKDILFEGKKGVIKNIYIIKQLKTQRSLALIC
jgi:hypothetical protein